MTDCSNAVMCINTFASSSLSGWSEASFCRGRSLSIVTDKAEKANTHRKSNSQLPHFHYLCKTPWLKISSTSSTSSLHIQTPSAVSSFFDVFPRISLVFISSVSNPHSILYCLTPAPCKLPPNKMLQLLSLVTPM